MTPVHQRDRVEKDHRLTTYVKFMMSSYEFASRNRREVDVVSSLGHSVAVSDVGATAGVEFDGAVAVHHRRKRTNRSVVIRRGLILLDCLWRLPRHLRQFEAKCLSCHDLIALSIGWFSRLTTPRKRWPQLVYDSHEFELGRHRPRPRSALHTALVKQWEGFLIKRCAFVISVNDSIAELLQDVHRLQRRPLVVRSTPPTWTLDPAVVQANRDSFCRSLNVPSNTFLAMYHGGVVRNRGIESFLTALPDVPGVAAVILGNGQPSYLADLRSLAERLGIASRVLFHPAVSVADLGHHVAAADVGMMAIRATGKSYYLALPNKLFENVQALNPVIGSAYPEISRIIDGYGIGLTVDPEDPEAIAAALNRIHTDEKLRRDISVNLMTAKKELCWEREREVLEDSYAALLGSKVQTHA